TAATDAGRIDQRRLIARRLRLLIHAATKRLRKLARRRRQPAHDPDAELVVAEILRAPPWSLLQHDNAEARLGQLSRHDAARRARTHDHEIDDVALRELPLLHHAALPSPPACRSSYQPNGG